MINEIQTRQRFNAVVKTGIPGFIPKGLNYFLEFNANAFTRFYSPSVWSLSQVGFLNGCRFLLKFHYRESA